MPVSSSDLSRRRFLFAVVIATVFSLAARSVGAVVFYARDEALQLAFPDADKVESRNFFLTPDQRSAIEKRAKSKVDSDLLTVYVGHLDGRVIGYAFIDTHVVRTLPETFLIVLDPKGRVSATHVLAFHEPTEYMPGERWLKQFVDRQDPGEIRIGRAIAGMTGSTLTAHAIAGAVRRALAIRETLLRGE